MLHTEGLIMRTVKYGESSLIVDVLTKEKGLLSFIIGGVRNKKSKIKGLLQLMSFVDIVSYFSERKTLHRIKEIKMNYVYKELPYEIVKRAIGIFILEVVRNTVKETEYHPELYDFVKSNFVDLDQRANSISHFHLLFMLRFTQYLGITPSYPENTDGVYFDLLNGIFTTTILNHNHFLDVKATQSFIKFLEMEQSEDEVAVLSKSERSELLDTFIEYYRIHIEHFKSPNSHLIFKEIFG